MAGCALFHAFLRIPATSCLDHLGERPVPDELSAVVGENPDGEPKTFEEVAAPLIEANEAREEAKRARLAAIDGASCRLDRLTGFGNEVDGETREMVADALSISMTATMWFGGVERFHYATFTCGEDELAVLLTQYQEGFGPTGRRDRQRRLHRGGRKQQQVDVPQQEGEGQERRRRLVEQHRQHTDGEQLSVDELSGSQVREHE